MPKRDRSAVPPALRQTYDPDPVAVSDAVARLAAHVARGEDDDTDVEDLPDADEGFPADGLDVHATTFPSTRKRETREAKKRPLRPFRAADHPHRDFRGERIVNGKKIRV